MGVNPSTIKCVSEIKSNPSLGRISAARPLQMFDKFLVQTQENKTLYDHQLQQLAGRTNEFIYQMNLHIRWICGKDELMQSEIIYEFV
jgi:hypothetical protein